MIIHLVSCVCSYCLNYFDYIFTSSKYEREGGREKWRDDIRIKDSNLLRMMIAIRIPRTSKHSWWERRKEEKKEERGGGGIEKSEGGKHDGV